MKNWFEVLSSKHLKTIDFQKDPYQALQKIFSIHGSNKELDEQIKEIQQIANDLNFKCPSKTQQRKANIVQKDGQSKEQVKNKETLQIENDNGKKESIICHTRLGTNARIAVHDFIQEYKSNLKKLTKPTCDMQNKKNSQPNEFVKYVDGLAVEYFSAFYRKDLKDVLKQKKAKQQGDLDQKNLSKHKIHKKEAEKLVQTTLQFKPAVKTKPDKANASPIRGIKYLNVVQEHLILKQVKDAQSIFKKAVGWFLQRLAYRALGVYFSQLFPENNSKLEIVCNTLQMIQFDINAQYVDKFDINVQKIMKDPHLMCQKCFKQSAKQNSFQYLTNGWKINDIIAYQVRVFQNTIPNSKNLQDSLENFLWKHDLSGKNLLFFPPHIVLQVRQDSQQVSYLPNQRLVLQKRSFEDKEINLQQSLLTKRNLRLLYDNKAMVEKAEKEAQQELLKRQKLEKFYNEDNNSQENQSFGVKGYRFDVQNKEQSEFSFKVDTLQKDQDMCLYEMQKSDSKKRNTKHKSMLEFKNHSNKQVGKSSMLDLVPITYDDNEISSESELKYSSMSQNSIQEQDNQENECENEFSLSSDLKDYLDKVAKRNSLTSMSISDMYRYDPQFEYLLEQKFLGIQNEDLDQKKNSYRKQNIYYMRVNQVRFENLRNKYGVDIKSKLDAELQHDKFVKEREAIENSDELIQLCFDVVCRHKFCKDKASKQDYIKDAILSERLAKVKEIIKEIQDSGYYINLQNFA